ncbi:MAG: TetR/AcrR family transcriptional regulator [Pseudomonadota bacterium]
MSEPLRSGIASLSESRSDAAAPEATGRSQDAILNAAALCFRDYGFAAASIDDVARVLNATKGRIYHHFRSKTDLFFAVYRRGMALNFEAVEPVFNEKTAPLEKIAKMALSHALVLLAQMPYQRVLAQGVHMHQTGATTAAQRETLADLIEIRNRYEMMFRKAIAAVVDTEDLPVNDIPLATRSFLAVLNGSVYWYSPKNDDIHGEQVRLAVKQVRFALRGLGASPPESVFDSWANSQIPAGPYETLSDTQNKAVATPHTTT